MFPENRVFEKTLTIVQNIQFKQKVKTRMFNDPSNTVSLGVLNILGYFT